MIWITIIICVTAVIITNIIMEKLDTIHHRECELRKELDAKK